MAPLVGWLIVTYGQINSNIASLELIKTQSSEGTGGETIVLNKNYKRIYIFAAAADSNERQLLKVTANGISLIAVTIDHSSVYDVLVYTAENCKQGSSITINWNWNYVYTIVGN